MPPDTATAPLELAPAHPGRGPDDRSPTQRRVIELLDALAPVEGYTLSPLPGVRYLRSNRPLTRTPVLYEPGIVIVCQGRKRGFFGDAVYLYDEQHYLVVSVALPFAMETEASAQRPLLALYLQLDFQLAAELLVEIEQHESLPAMPPQGMISSPLEPPLQESVLRLVQALAQPLEAAVLGRSLLREVYFRVLQGEQAGSMRAAIAKQGQFGKVAKAIRRIHDDYARSLSVDELAQAAGMSHASFHDHFRRVTNTTPLQYLKSTRLHQARLLMVRHGMTAAAAAGAVGYESPQQFSREFQRFFGRPPRQEALRLRSSFAFASTGREEFVASH
jgi:AraC-like DNA-binding protein